MSAAEPVEQAHQVWRASLHHPQVQELAHWRGHGRWADDQEWLDIGRKSLAMLRKTLRVFFPELGAALEAWQPGAEPLFSGPALEWGPGGGSNALTLAPLFPRYYGVDISEASLAECARQCASANLAGFVPVHLTAPDPMAVVGQIPEAVDFVLSTAVFQHFPGQEYAQQALHALYALMSPGALAIIQIRYDDGKARFSPKSGDYPSQCAVYTSFKLDEFYDMCEVARLDVLEILITNPRINYATFILSSGGG